MGYEPTFLFITALVHMLLAYLVMRAATTVSGRIFSLAIASVGVWALGSALLPAAPGASGVSIGAMLFAGAAAAAPALLYLFARTHFAHAPLRMREAIHGILMIGMALVLTTASDRSAIVSAVLYTLYGGAYLALTYRVVAQGSARVHAPAMSMRIRAIMVGATLPLFAGMVASVIVVSADAHEFLWIGPFISLLVAGVVPAAIRYFHLLRMDMLATEALVVVLWFVLLARVVTAESWRETMAGAVLLACATALGALLVRGVSREASAMQDLRRLVSDLMIANRRLRLLDEQKSGFISIASHQLRTPITAIKGYASMAIEHSFGDVDSGVRAPLEKILASSESLVALVENLLEVSRLEEGNMEFAFRSVDLRELVERIGNDYAQKLRARDIRFSVRLADDMPYPVRGDERLLTEVVGSCIENGLRVAPGGMLEVLLSHNRHTGRVRLAISDNGPGVDHRTLDAFSREHNTAHGGPSRRVGPWLWLYTAFNIVRAHGGLLWVESGGLGKGATYFIELPPWGTRGVMPHTHELIETDHMHPLSDHKRERAHRNT